MDRLKMVGSFVASRYALVAFAVIAVLCPAWCHAAPETVTVNMPEIDFASVATGLITKITPALVAAIGLGLGIWGFRWVYKTFRSMAR